MMGGTVSHNRELTDFLGWLTHTQMGDRGKEAVAVDMAWIVE
jgi:hypothetical protein